MLCLLTKLLKVCLTFLSNAKSMLVLFCKFIGKLVNFVWVFRGGVFCGLAGMGGFESRVWRYGHIWSLIETLCSIYRGVG